MAYHLCANISPRQIFVREKWQWCVCLKYQRWLYLFVTVEWWTPATQINEAIKVYMFSVSQLLFTATQRQTDWQRGWYVQCQPMCNQNKCLSTFWNVVCCWKIDLNSFSLVGKLHWFAPHLEWHKSLCLCYKMNEKYAHDWCWLTVMPQQMHHTISFFFCWYMQLNFFRWFFTDIFDLFNLFLCDARFVFSQPHDIVQPRDRETRTFSNKK